MKSCNEDMLAKYHYVTAGIGAECNNGDTAAELNGFHLSLVEADELSLTIVART